MRNDKVLSFLLCFLLCFVLSFNLAGATSTSLNTRHTRSDSRKLFLLSQDQPKACKHNRKFPPISMRKKSNGRDIYRLRDIEQRAHFFSPFKTIHSNCFKTFFKLSFEAKLILSVTVRFFLVSKFDILARRSFTRIYVRYKFQI